MSVRRGVVPTAVAVGAFVYGMLLGAMIALVVVVLTR